MGQSRRFDPLPITPGLTRTCLRYTETAARFSSQRKMSQALMMFVTVAQPERQSVASSVPSSANSHAGIRDCANRRPPPPIQRRQERSPLGQQIIHFSI
jgi:hypothetical protein